MSQLNKVLLPFILLILCLAVTTAHSSEFESDASINKNYKQHCTDSYSCKTHPSSKDIEKLKQIFIVNSSNRLETIAQYHDAEIKLFKKTINTYKNMLKNNELRAAAYHAIQDIVLSQKKIISNYKKLSQNDSLFFSQNSSVLDLLGNAIVYTKKWEDEIDRLNSDEAKRTLKYKVSKKFWNKYGDDFKRISKLEIRLINKYYKEELRLRPYDLINFINFQTNSCKVLYNAMRFYKHEYTPIPKYAFLESESNSLYLFKIPLTEVDLIKKILSGFNGKRSPLSVVCIDKGKTGIWGNPEKRVKPDYSKRKNTLYLKNTSVYGMSYYKSELSDVFELLNIPIK